MYNKLFIRKTAVSVILFFSFFMFQTNFNYANEEDILKKARVFINDGNLTDAISELTRIIGRLKNIDEKRKKIAEAYYLLAKVHYDGGDDKKFEENIRMVFKTYPGFNIDESNFEIKDIVKKIKTTIETKNIKAELNNKIEEVELKKKKVGRKTLFVFLTKRMQLLYYKIIKKAKLLDIEDDMKISGQISFLLEVDQNGKLDVIEVNDKWLNIIPQNKKTKIIKKIIANISKLKFPPPKDKNGGQVILKKWRVSFKIMAYYKVILQRR